MFNEIVWKFYTDGMCSSMFLGCKCLVE